MKELKIKLLKTWWQASMGLMGRSEPESAFFTTRWGIHTFFVKFPIDVIVLDRENTIQLLKRGLLPNRILVWNPKYYRILELPNGTIDKFAFKKGEKITITFL